MNSGNVFILSRSKGHDMLAPFTAGWQSADLDPLVIAKSEVPVKISFSYSVNVESNSCVSVTFFLQGSYVYDDTGKKYLDSLAGLWCTALGILPSNTTKHELMFLFLQFGIP